MLLIKGWGGLSNPESFFINRDIFEMSKPFQRLHIHRALRLADEWVEVVVIVYGNGREPVFPLIYKQSTI